MTRTVSSCATSRAPCARVSQLPAVPAVHRAAAGQAGCLDRLGSRGGWGPCVGRALRSAVALNREWRWQHSVPEQRHGRQWRRCQLLRHWSRARLRLSGLGRRREAALGRRRPARRSPIKQQLDGGAAAEEKEELLGLGHRRAGGSCSAAAGQRFTAAAPRGLHPGSSVAPEQCGSRRSAADRTPAQLGLQLRERSMRSED